MRLTSKGNIEINISSFSKMTLEDLKTILKGAIGSLTFGVYHTYLTTIMINENNRITQLKFDEINRTTQLKFDEINRTTQLKFDEIDRTIQLRFDELFKKIEGRREGNRGE